MRCNLRWKIPNRELDERKYIFYKIYFITKFYQSVFYISWSANRDWKEWQRLRRCLICLFIYLFLLTSGGAQGTELNRANTRKENKALNRCQCTTHFCLNFFAARILLLPAVRLSLYSGFHPSSMFLDFLCT